MAIAEAKEKIEEHLRDWEGFLIGAGIGFFLGLGAGYLFGGTAAILAVVGLAVAFLGYYEFGIGLSIGVVAGVLAAMYGFGWFY